MTNSGRTVLIMSVAVIATLSSGRATSYGGDMGPVNALTASPTPNRTPGDSGSPCPKDPTKLPPAPVLASDVPEIGLAAFNGDVSNLRRLIASGANIEAVGKDKRTPLLLASAGGGIECVSALLAAGANINARDSGGSTALHWAAKIGDETLAFLLLSHGPEVNVQDIFGATPLMIAAIVGNKPIVEALLAAGANPNLADVFGRTASAFAKRDKHLDIAALLDQHR